MIEVCNMTILDLISTNSSITNIDIYDKNNCIVSSLKQQDFKKSNLLNEPIKRWYITSITITNLTLAVSLDIDIKHSH